ncbi:unnamed protein product [Choristocarpus tenellus]
MGGNERDFGGEANELLQYLLTAKLALDEDVYASFVRLLNSYHARMTNAEDLIKGALEFFCTHPHLLTGLKNIIPELDHSRIDDLIKTTGSVELKHEGKNSPTPLDCRSGWNHLPTETIIAHDTPYEMLHSGILGSELGEGEFIGEGTISRSRTLDTLGQMGALCSSKNQRCFALKNNVQLQRLPPPSGGGTFSSENNIDESAVPDNTKALCGQGPPDGDVEPSLFEAIMTDYTQDGVHSEPLAHLEYPQQTKAKPLSSHLHQDLIPPQNNNLQVVDSDTPHTTQVVLTGCA